MNRKIISVASTPVFYAALLVLLTAFILYGQFNNEPPVIRRFDLSTTDRIARMGVFSIPIVSLDRNFESGAEADLLLELLTKVQRSRFQEGLPELEQYLAAFTNSPWRESLDAALADYYYQTGLITKSLEHSELAWLATKDYPNGDGKKVADFTLANWTSLLARLGRVETLGQLVEQNRRRILDRGPFSGTWLRNVEAYNAMLKLPGQSYQCGTFALNRVSQELGVKYNAKALLDIPSPESGFSIARLTELSDQLGLGLLPVYRESSSSVPVPSVVHWRQDHYAAIVRQRQDGLFLVVDPTFGHPRLLTAETINAEASGYFFVAANRVEAGYRLISQHEANSVYGRGNPNFIYDLSDQGCEECERCPAGSGGGSGTGSGGGSGCGLKCGGPKAMAGMPVWGVSEPQINLWLHDEPLGYQPAVGSRVSLNLSYKQREPLAFSGVGYEIKSSSLGWNWTFDWLSSIRNIPMYFGLIKEIHYGKGGGQFFTLPDSDPGEMMESYYNDLKIFSYTNELGYYVYFDVLHRDGSKDVYGFAPTNSGGLSPMSYLTEKITTDGKATRFYYETYNPDDVNVRLTHVVDADGKTNTLYYATSGYSTNLITQVTDGYGRSAYFSYDADGLLTSITDVAGMTSTMGYDQNGWITNLTTLYGTTSFEQYDPFSHANPTRRIKITKPNGGKEVYLFTQYSGFGVSSYSDPSLIPTNTPIGTLNNESLNWRVSYHWNSLQFSGLSTTDPDYFVENDYFRGRMRHWLGAVAAGDYKSMDTLSLERLGSPDGATQGQLTWYDYANKGSYGTGDKGDHVIPNVIARVNPDGSTWYQWNQYNWIGQLTNSVETYTKHDSTIDTRTNRYYYAANGIDLQQHIGTEGEQVVSNYFNAYHQVLASYDALNQETKYTYDATTRLLTSIISPSGLTTTNIYDANSRLQKTIDLEISRTNSYTYTGDLVYSHTDERGLTVTNYWDNLQRFVGRQFPDGTTISNIYTTLDITAMKDRMGFWSYAAYNGIRQKVADTNANGVVTRYGLCECGSVLSVTNAWNTPEQMVTSFGYDYQGNRIYTYLPDMTVTNWYDSLQRVVATSDGWGNKWFGYNNQGLLVSVTNGLSAMERLTTYSIDDHPLYVTDANGVTITNTYDELHRLQTRTYPDTGVERFGYSARGLTDYTNQLNFVTRYVYDEAGRKRFETNANSEVIRYTNNAAGDLLALVDGKNQVTKWNYDSYGRVTNKLDQAGSTTFNYRYDFNGRLTNRLANSITFTIYRYDAVGNLTNIDYSSGADVVLLHDPMNRVTNMTDAIGETKYAYTAAGRLFTEDGPFADDTMTNYYRFGLRTNLLLMQPSANWTSEYWYDAAKRLTSVTSPAGAFDYTFVNGSSRLAQKLLLPNGAYITNAYDNVSRMRFTKLNNSSHTTVDAMNYGLNLGSQRTTITNASGAWWTNRYDPIGQLTVVDSSVNGEDRGYAYDAAWNLNVRTNNGATQEFTVNVKNELTAIETWPLDRIYYDTFGNLAFWEQPFDTDATFRWYGYDMENRLVEVLEAYGIAGYEEDAWPSLKVTYEYDGMGHLKRRGVYWYDGDDWVESELTTYIYDGWRVIQDRNGSNVPTVSYTRGTDLSGSLEGAGGIGGMLARSHGYNTGSGAWGTNAFYHADGNGNITYLMKSDQALGASYRYDAYGEMLTGYSGSLAFANSYRFSSKMYDLLVNMLYYGYRWYAPYLQRWVNRDPLGERGFEVLRKSNSIIMHDGVNPYAFVHNNPANSLDSWGLSIWLCNRKVNGFPFVGNHTYLWDDRNNKSCGMNSSSGTGPTGSPNDDKGPGQPGQDCTKVGDSDGKENAVMGCCKEDANDGVWFPWINDCHNAAKDCLKENGLTPPLKDRTGPVFSWPIPGVD